jgi:hypothetical protein
MMASLRLIPPSFSVRRSFSRRPAARAITRTSVAEFPSISQAALALNDPKADCELGSAIATTIRCVQAEKAAQATHGRVNVNCKVPDGQPTKSKHGNG